MLLPVDWYQSDHKLFTGLSQYLVSLSELLGVDTVVKIDCELVYRDAVTQIAELLEIIGASEHSELVIREQNFPQLQYLVETFSNNLVNFVKIRS